MREVSRAKQPCLVFTLLSLSCLCSARTMASTWVCSRATGLERKKEKEKREGKKKSLQLLPRSSSP